MCQASMVGRGTQLAQNWPRKLQPPGLSGGPSGWERAIRAKCGGRGAGGRLGSQALSWHRLLPPPHPWELRTGG